MRTSIYLINRSIRKWNVQLEETLGLKIEPHFLVASATLLVLFVQLLLYLALSSQTIYCQIPNLSLFYQTRAIPSYEKMPTIYVVTPTYSRFVQRAELTRLSQTLMLVPNLHWIIVEDADRATGRLSRFIRRLKNDYDFYRITHLNEPTPQEFKLKPGEPNWKKPKGVWQRNKALAWVQRNLNDLDRDGAIYFADDDNTYDLELFNEMRFTRRVSVWPVGLVGGMLVEKPVLKDGRVISFNSMWQSERPFPIDMAGFAVSLQMILSRPNLTFSAEQRIGYVESHFLGQLVSSWDELEPKADKCTKVLVWHTKTQVPNLHEEKKLTKPSYIEVDD